MHAVLPSAGAVRPVDGDPSSSPPKPRSRRRKGKEPRPKVKVAPRSIGPIHEPNENDVLCGRGGRVNSHEGNMRFRALVDKTKERYLAETTKKLEKAFIASDLVNLIRKMNPPGRFLKEDSDGGPWYDIGDAKAFKKVGQALREDAPDIRKVNPAENNKNSKQEKEKHAVGTKKTQKKIMTKKGVEGETKSKGKNRLLNAMKKAGDSVASISSSRNRNSLAGRAPQLPCGGAPQTVYANTHHPQQLYHQASPASVDPYAESPVFSSSQIIPLDSGHSKQPNSAQLPHHHMGPPALTKNHFQQQNQNVPMPAPSSQHADYLIKQRHIQNQIPTANGIKKGYSQTAKQLMSQNIYHEPTPREIAFDKDFYPLNEGSQISGVSGLSMKEGSVISAVSSLTAGTAAGIRTSRDYRRKQSSVKNNYLKKFNTNITNDCIMENDRNVFSNNDIQPLPLQDPPTMQHQPMIVPPHTLFGQQSYTAGGMKRSLSDPSLGSLIREDLRSACDNVTLESIGAPQDDFTLGSGLSKFWDLSSNASRDLHQSNLDNFGNTSVYSAMSISQISNGLGNMSIYSVENSSMAELSGIFSNTLSALDLATLPDD